MIVKFKSSFLKDIKKIKDTLLKDEVYKAITQAEDVAFVSEIHNLKKLKGYNSSYRIRIGDYRIGIKITDQVVHFVAFSHRKDIYKKFP